jgi:hypothetical protein
MPVDLPPAMVCATPPPPGTGLAANGRGIIHIPKPGIYTFHGAVVNTLHTSSFVGGDYGSVQQINSAPMEWTRPDGVREKVPTTLLYPPMGIAPPTYE